MKYIVEIEDRTYEVEIGRDGIRLGGRAVEADLQANHASHLWHLVLDGKSHTLQARRQEDRGVWEIEIDGRRHSVLALDERRWAIRHFAGSAATRHGPVEVKAPMPGLIVKVEVDRDDEVARGQGLVVIEAMKMENEIKATADGRVSDVQVTAGQTVDKGETLLVVEPAPEGQ